MWGTDKLVKGEECAEGFASGRIWDNSVDICCLSLVRKLRLYSALDQSSFSTVQLPVFTDLIGNTYL